MTEYTFHIKENSSLVPCGFACRPLDLLLPEFTALAETFVCCVEVDSPPGWKVVRTADFEAPHLDVFLIYTGTVRYENAQGRLDAGAGDTLVLPSWIERRVELPEGSTHLYCRINRVDLYPELNKPQLRSQRDKIIRASKFYFDELYDSASAASWAREYRTSVAEIFLQVLVNEIAGGAPSGGVEEAARLRRLLEQLKSFEVAELAHLSGMSLSALRQATFRHFQCSPGKLIEEYRMNLARGLLRFWGTGIEDIAERLHYTNRFSFTKAFTRFHGISPVRFRKRP